MQNWTVRERAGLAALAVALTVGGIGLWSYRQQTAGPASPQLMQITPPPTSTEVLARGPDEIVPPDVAVTERSEPLAPPIVVYVSGAVRRPGVYTLKKGDRIYKAIQAAGGPKANANEGALNLADVLQDGDQINVPARGAPIAPPPPVRPAATAPAQRPSGQPARGRVLGSPSPPSPTKTTGEGAESTPTRGIEKFRNPGDGTVNINTASVEELQRLPGIGPAMAERIITYRQEVGAFNAPEQLMDVRGIGEKKFAAMQPFVRVN